jgi:Protein tyrosine and serine/threonine kinase
MSFVVNKCIMEKPENCDDFLYKLMKCCWKFEPSKRLKFYEIVKVLLAKLTEPDDEFVANFKQNLFFYNQ